MSDYIRDLLFLWTNVADQPAPESDRAYIEQNAIALVSNYRKDAIDPRPDKWLGTDSRSTAIRESGLWNVDHVDETYEPAFLDRLAEAVEDTTPS